MKEQINCFGGIQRIPLRSTPELEHLPYDDRAPRAENISGTVQRLRKSGVFEDECHSEWHVENWKMRRELDRLRAEIET